MPYRGTLLSDTLSVTEIYTVLRPDLTAHYPGRGESHPFPEIIYLAKGEHTLLIDKQRYSLREGQMIVYAPHSFHESSDVRPTCAHACILTFASVSPSLASLYNRVLTLSKEQRIAIEGIVDEGVQYFCNRAPDDLVRGMLLRKGVDPSALSGLRKRIELFLIDLCRENPVPKTKTALRWDAEYADALSFLERNIASPLSLSQIALGCSMSVSKLKQLFRERTGAGPIDCLIRLRIERAKVLIREGTYNMTEIAEQVGFSSLHYFSRTFKAHTGLSPTEYAKQI